MIKKAIDKYFQCLKSTLKSVDEEKTRKLIFNIIKANRVFIFGAGRSGLVGKAFAMRLMHMDKQVYWIGETITPAVEKGDLVFFLSGSGNTLSVVNMIKAAKKNGIKVQGITSRIDGYLYKKGEDVIYLDTEEKETSGDYLAMQLMGQYRNITPLGTNFESSAHVYLDCLIVLLMAELDKDEDDLRKKHANIE